MKTKSFTLALTLAFTLPVCAQLGAPQEVIDRAQIKQKAEAHEDDLAKFVDMINNQIQQITTLTQQLAQLEFLSKVFGDPGTTTNLGGLAEVLENLAGKGVNVTRADLLSRVNAQDALWDTGGGIFTAVGDSFQTLDGVVVPRREADYKPNAAIFQAVANHDAVQADAKERRQHLRDGMRQTLDQLQRATTAAESQKLQGVLLGQVAELEATDRDLTFAAQQVVVQDVENRNARQRQETAAREEQAAEFSAALSKLGELLRPDTTSTRLGPAAR